MIRVLIADDQPLIRDALRGILSHQDDVEMVAEATDGAAATRLATDVDVVLMDIRMPGTDGIEATREIMAAPDPPRVLILTTFDLDEYVHACLRAGASGFLLKDSEPSSIVAAIRSAVAGDAVLAPSVTRRLISTYVGTPAPGTAIPGALTQRETDVLRAMAQGLSNAEVAHALFLGETTVKTHVTSILAKLGVRDRLQAVIRAYEYGLVRPGNS